MSDRGDKLLGQRIAFYEDLALFFCGKHLGGGIGREVFALRGDTSKVLKFGCNAGNQNIIEYELWNVVESNKKLAPWFAPCYDISGLGLWMLQARTHPIEKADLPKKVPAIFTDLKAENWGWLNNRPVCHDYGTVLCRMVTSSVERLRRADWN
jgi:hypothetical protein